MYLLVHVPPSTEYVSIYICVMQGTRSYMFRIVWIHEFVPPKMSDYMVLASRPYTAGIPPEYETRIEINGLVFMFV